MLRAFGQPLIFIIKKGLALIHAMKSTFNYFSFMEQRVLKWDTESIVYIAHACIIFVRGPI